MLRNIAITLCFSHAVTCTHTHCALSRAARGRRGETHRARAGCPLSSAHVTRSLLLMMPFAVQHVDSPQRAGMRADVLRRRAARAEH